MSSSFHTVVQYIRQYVCEVGYQVNYFTIVQFKIYIKEELPHQKYSY